MTNYRRNLFLNIAQDNNVSNVAIPIAPLAQPFPQHDRRAMPDVERDLEGELCDAIMAHNYNLVRILIDEGANIHQTTTDLLAHSELQPVTAWEYAVAIHSSEAIINLLRNNTSALFGGPR